LSVKSPKIEVLEICEHPGLGTLVSLEHTNCYTNFFSNIFTNYSTGKGLSARNEIEEDQGLEGFEEVG